MTLFGRSYLILLNKIFITLSDITNIKTKRTITNNMSRLSNLKK